MMHIPAQALQGLQGETLCQLPELLLRPGERWVVLGPNGAGKSTFLRHCAGHPAGTPRTATWRWLGQPLPLWHDPDWARQRAVLSQQHEVSGQLSVHDMLCLASFPWSGRHPRLVTAFERVVADWELGRLLSRRWGQLSGGEQQRLQLARNALQLDLAGDDAPRLWLLDEPLTALDWPHQQRTLTACHEASARGVLVITSLHDMNAAWSLATHVLVLAQGRVIHAGEREQGSFAEALAEAFAMRLSWVAHPRDGRPWLIPG